VAAVVPGGPRSAMGQAAVVDGVKINFDYWAGEEKHPVVFFLPGFFYGRDRRAKSTALGIAAKRAGFAFLTADYMGTGKSEGDFEKEGTLSVWIAHSVALLDEIVGDRPVVLVGAGVGGWIMLHVAQMRKKNVVGLVGCSVSVDFTEDLIRPKLTAPQLAEIEDKGFVDLPWGQTSYPIGRALLDDAARWLCLRGGSDSIDIDRPVRLIQGMEDEEIPAARALQLVDALHSDDVVVSFVKNGDHILEEEADFRRLWRAVVNVSDCYYEYDLTSPGSG
jgi:pimeloyl-ACP methyl ester carboxylesterase